MIVVVGGGIAGIVSAILLQKKFGQVCIIERNDRIGGLYRSKRCDLGVTFDYGSHFLRPIGHPELDNILFGSEMVGAVRGIDPQTGQYFDDTRLYVEGLGLTEAQQEQIFSGNARRVYPKLDEKLKARGL